MAKKFGANVSLRVCAALKRNNRRTGKGKRHKALVKWEIHIFYSGKRKDVNRKHHGFLRALLIKCHLIFIQSRSGTKLLKYWLKY